MMKNFIIIGLILVSLIASAFCMLNRQRNGFVKISDVFEEFTLKKELQADYDKKRNTVKKELDEVSMNLVSLRMKTQRSASQVQVDSINLLSEQLQKLESDFEMIESNVKAEYDTQIHNQLRQYLKEFGENNRLDLLLGLGDDGTVLMSSDQSDYTAAAIAFCNKRYADQ